MRREGSPWQGFGVVYFRELFDHLTSVRMLVLEFLVLVFGAAVATSAAAGATVAAPTVLEISPELTRCSASGWVIPPHSGQHARRFMNRS